MRSVRALLPWLAALAVFALFGSPALATGVDATAKACGPNLITNGSFERGTTPGSYLTIKTGSDDLDDWTVSKGTVDVVGSLWPASVGDRSIDLDGTTFGETMRVRADDAGTQYTFDDSKRPYHQMGWQTHAWRFVATERSTTIEFESLDTESGYFGPVIDNVQVQATCG